MHSLETRASERRRHQRCSRCRQRERPRSQPESKPRLEPRRRASEASDRSGSPTRAGIPQPLGPLPKPSAPRHWPCRWWRATRSRHRSVLISPFQIACHLGIHSRRLSGAGFRITAQPTRSRLRITTASGNCSAGIGAERLRLQIRGAAPRHGIACHVGSGFGMASGCLSPCGAVSSARRGGASRSS